MVFGYLGTGARKPFKLGSTIRLCLVEVRYIEPHHYCRDPILISLDPVSELEGNGRNTGTHWEPWELKKFSIHC